MSGAYRWRIESEWIEGILVESLVSDFVDDVDPTCERCADYQMWVDENSFVVRCPDCGHRDPVMA